MGRPVAIRVSYAQDAGYLNRLLRAIEADPKMGSKRKKASSILLNTLTAILMVGERTGNEMADSVIAKMRQNED